MTGQQWVQPPRAGRDGRSAEGPTEDEPGSGIEWTPAESTAEPEVPDPGAGEWTDEAIISVVADASIPALSTLYLLDPEETELIYGPWVLGDEATARLRDLHRRGLCTPGRARVSEVSLSSRAVRMTLVLMPVLGIVCLFITLIYVALAMRGSSALPGWPTVALWCGAVGAGAVAATAAVQHFANREILGAPLSQVTALFAELESRRVRQQTDAAAQLAARLREAWLTVADGDHGNGLRKPEQSTLSARMDQLLWDLARTETLTDEAAQVRALGAVAEDCETFIDDLASVAPAVQPWPAPAEPTTPTDHSAP